MILGRLQQSPRKMVPVAMMLLVTGLMILLTGIQWPRMKHAAVYARTGWDDFFWGVMVGVGIAMEALGVVIAASAARITLRKNL